MIIYFTGTENSRLLAERLGELLGDKVVDSRPYIKSGKPGNFPSETPYIFVSPTYSWQLASIFRDFLLKSQVTARQAAYFVLSCGDSTGNAGHYAEQLCEQLNLTYRGLWSVVMPENYLAMFPVPDAEEAAEIIRKAMPALPQMVPYIQSNAAFPREEVSLIGKLQSSFIHNFFFRYLVKADAFRSTDACISCGRCVEACVLNNITLEADRPVWGKNCTHCMACICGCPVQAIEYGKKSQGRPRYWCPQYKK